MTEEKQTDETDEYVEVEEDAEMEEVETEEAARKRSVRLEKNTEVYEKQMEKIDKAREEAKAKVDKTKQKTKERVDKAQEEVKERVDETVKKSVEGFDKSLVNLLTSFLETETRAKVYLYLRKHDEATSDEIAEGTGLYPSTVRGILSDLYDEGIVDRTKQDTEGSGNKPYVYSAIPPSELARRASKVVEKQLNRLTNLDAIMRRREGEEFEGEIEDEEVELEEDEETGRREIKTKWSPYKIVIEYEGEEEDLEDEEDEESVDIPVE